MAIAVHSPHDEIAELSRLVGSQNGVARVLGRTPAVLSRWSHQPDKIRPTGRRLLSEALAVTSKVADVYGIEGQLESLLVTPRPELGYLLPAELIREGRAEELVKRLDQLAGGEAFAVPVHSAETAGMTWKVDLQQELDESLAGERLHEGFVFLAALTQEQREEFAGLARKELAAADSEEEFDRFLEPYWQQLQAAPRHVAVTTIPPEPGEESVHDEFNIDDLLIPDDGGMTSRRFSDAW